MATPVITPAAPAAAAAPVTTAPVSTAAPVSATPAPVTDGAGGAGALDSAATRQAMVDFAASRGFGETLEQNTATETPAVQTEKPAAATEQTPAAEATSGDGNVAEEDEPSYTLDEDGFVGAKDLASKIDANPALKAALDTETRNEILANARLAEVGAEYRELFASPQEAKIVAETAQEHAGFIEAFNMLATDPVKGADLVITKLIEAGAKRDADGNIMRDANGQPITNGIAGRFFNQIFERKMAAILKKVEALGDENVQAATDLFMESAGLRPSTADKNESQDPDLAARKAELDRQQAEINRQREAATQEQRTQYDNALRGDLASLYEREVGKLLGLATGLDSFAREAVEHKLEQGIRQAIKTNTAYQMRKDRLQAMPLSPERRAKEVALANEFFRNNLTRVAAPILKQAGIMAKGKASERTEKSAARAENARSEVSGGRAAAPGTSNVNASPAQMREQAIANFKAQNGGREPSDSELTVAMMLAAVQRRGLAA